MNDQTIKRFFSAPRALRLYGVRRGAMMLLTTLLLTMTAQTAWADNVTLSVDNDYNNTDVGYYYAKMPNSPNVKSTLTLNEEGVTACNGAFKLYDSGGKNGDYNAANDYGTKFTIEVPDDYVLNITGSSRSTYDHNWNIYDSSDTDDSKLLINLRQENNDIDVTTTGKYVTIYFQAPTSSKRQYSQWGLNLTVKLLSATNSIPLSTITGIKRVYKRTGSAISLGYTVKSLSNVTLTKDVDFTETITKNGTVVDNAVENGDYTLTIAGKDPYFGKQTFDFSVSDNDYISVSSDTKVMYNCAYKVQQNVTISDRIVVNGDVTLTLEEGYTLTAQHGIEVEAGNTLTINGTGSLTIPTGGNYCAGIGSNNGKEYGHIIINGGIITTQGGQYGAGIGGGYENVDNGNCSITINGGVINATGDANAAGIGGGYGGAHNNNPRGAAGTIIINGGQVTALQKSFSGSSTHCGIGHGYMYSGGGGSLTLDWTRESDFINCFKYNITNINFGGKDFVLDEDNTVTATISNIDGKKIIPKLDNLVLSHATINNLCSLYRYTGSEIILGYTIKSTDGTTTLVKGTDYSETITKGGVTSIVKDKGEYTLTITGLGDYYTGTKSYTFSVADIDEDLTQDGNEYYVNLPSDGSTKTVNLIENQTIKVYDSEGKNGSLVVSDGYLLLQAPDGYALEVTGKTDAMRYNTANSLWVNSLSAYEGDNTTNEIIKLLTNSDNILFASGGKVMRMRLNVTALYTFASQYGLDLTVRVIPQQLYTITKGTASNGSIDIADNKTTANTNEMITLTVNPAEGHLLKRLTITDTDGGSTIQTIGEDQWYSGVNTISFEMPSRNITITPEFTNSLTAAGGLSMNIDLSGTKEYVIPEIVQSFNIRASAVDNPTNGSVVTIILKAHNEYCLQATGQIEFANVSTDDGEISIYDGANTSATLLTNIKGASKETVSIGTQTSSSNYMTIYLSEEDVYYSVFTGTIETQVKNYSITYDLAGGSVATENPTTYNYKTDAFTLTNPTREGYEFAGWTGTGLDAASTSVTIAKGSTGKREYTATWKKLLTNGDITVDAIADQTYTGSEIKPTVTMKDGETLLTENTDYTLSYSANTNVGEATVTITGAGNYAGTKTATFTINRKAVTITADSDSKEYDGTALTKSTFTTTDLEAGDTHAFTVVMTTESTITNVGSKANVIATVDGVAVTAGTPTAVGNYIVTTADGTLTINKKTVSTDGAIEVTQDENGYYATFSGSPNDAVSIMEPITVKGVTLERSFANGKYATLMLPFSLNANSQTGQTLTGANIYQFVGVEKVSGQWIATMQTPTTPLQANTPYLVEPVTSGLTTDGYLTFGLNGGTVTLQTTASAEGSTNSDWQFVGTYTRLTYKADGSANLTGNIYGFASKNKTVDGVDVMAGEFVKAKDGAAVPPLRCYLTYKNGDEFTGAPARGMTRSAEEELPQSIIVRLVGANGETTNVMTIDTRTGEISTDGWYSIDGVKLSGKPTTKGLYINNGRKVVIK